ncbi:hypothetical protein HY251_04730 [bacterium]|nr:hypothetical protein [bacterium]
MRRPGRAGALVFLGALALCPGCGAAALIHDKTIGPISPAGYVHPLVTGENFVVDEQGPHVDQKDTALLRPFPRDFLDRGATFVPLARGLEFGIAGFSIFVKKDGLAGAPVPADTAKKLRLGMSVEEILALLGAPRIWIKREHLSFMGYQADVGLDLDLHIGCPPGVSDLIPIPGISSLSFARSAKSRTPVKTMLFFDSEDRLISAVSNERPEE